MPTKGKLKNRPKFNQLAIYKQIRRSKLSKRTQDEVLKKMSGYYNRGSPLDTYNFGDFVNKVRGTNEGWDYWKKMYLDSGCWEEEHGN
jgi:hypothetical protein